LFENLRVGGRSLQMFKFSFGLRENGEREKERVYMLQTGIFVRLDLESFKLS